MDTFEKPTHEELARYLKALGRLIKAESQRLEAIYELSKVGPDDFLRLHVESERLHAWSNYFARREGGISERKMVNLREPLQSPPWSAAHVRQSAPTPGPVKPAHRCR